MVLLEVSEITKKVGGDWVLQHVSFTQSPQQQIALAGETGSGKSTLLKVIAGLVQPDNGRVLLRGERVRGPAEQLVPGTPSIAYLSQHFELPKFLKVAQVLSYANELTTDRAGLLYEICQIDHLLHRATDQLSGGERQRVALARLLSTTPELLLLDEPFSNLDSIHKNSLKQVITDSCEQLAITCVLVSHDPVDTLPWAHQILVMKSGRLIQHGTAPTIYSEPKDEYVAGLFGKFNALTPEQTNSFLQAGFAIKNTIVRPEQFLIGKTGSGVDAIVTGLRYFGSYVELDVRVADGTLVAQTQPNFFTIGERIKVTYLDYR